MEFLAKVAASLLTALAAFAANLTPSPTIPVAAAAKVDQPVVTAQLHETEPSAIDLDCEQFVVVTAHGDSAHVKLLIVSGEASTEVEPFDSSALLEAEWSPKSNALATLPWYVDTHQREDTSVFLARLSRSSNLTR